MKVEIFANMYTIIEYIYDYRYFFFGDGEKMVANTL